MAFWGYERERVVLKTEQTWPKRVRLSTRCELALCTWMRLPTRRNCAGSRYPAPDTARAYSTAYPSNFDKYSCTRARIPIRTHGSHAFVDDFAAYGLEKLHSAKKINHESCRWQAWMAASSLLSRRQSTWQGSWETRCATFGTTSRTHVKPPFTHVCCCKKKNPGLGFMDCCVNFNRCFFACACVLLCARGRAVYHHVALAFVQGRNRKGLPCFFC